MTPAEISKPGLDKAIAVCGSKAKLARAIDRSAMTINNWEMRGIPVDQCAHVERMLRGKVKRAELRPDHFGKL